MRSRKKILLMYSQLKIYCTTLKLKIMQKIMQSRLFRLLSKTSQNEAYVSQLEDSYDDFALKIFTRLQLDDNHQELFFILGFVHSKLTGIHERLSGEPEKKCYENYNQGHVFGWNGYAGIGMANHSTKQQKPMSVRK
ncbi:hypothetical protein LJB91_01770 [Bacteroidales bacterium OttesenSCG-928-L03]|nr:hypothetical protein [Bacteroidales bacterium OttesenSCG-928-L03]